MPSQPGKPEVENVDKTSISVTWTPPESDGGSPITNYIIEKYDLSRKKWVKTGPKVSETTFVVNDLTDGNDYQFRVSAENKAGVGKPSLPSDTIPAKLPFGKKIATRHSGYHHVLPTSFIN